MRALSLILVALLPLSANAQQPKKLDFAHDILPILKARCAECHTNGKYKASFSLDTREDILKSKMVILGKSGESELVKRITSNKTDFQMPPEGARLTAKEVELIKTWIDEKLPWQEGFSFKAGTYVAPLKPRKPELPAIVDGRSHPIDRILDKYYATHKVTLPPALDDATFLRRVYLDVIGLLPTPAELDAFQKNTMADKRTVIVQQLLDDKRAFADHWLTFWNDMLRNDYAGTGYIDGGRKPISAWLYRSIVENKPYDQFVRELISPTPESEGFIFGIKWRGNVNASQVSELQFSQNISQVFFGINMKCASCHDSFIDHWKLDDAYSLAAVTANQPLEIHRCDKPTGKKAQPRFMFPELGSIDAAAPRGKRLEQLSKLVTHPENGRFTRTIANRIWQRLMGRGIVHPVDVMGNRPWSEDLLDHLGVFVAENQYDLKKLILHIVTSRAYQSRHVIQTKEIPAEEFVFRGPEVKRMTAEQFLDGVWMVTRTAPGKQQAPVAPPAFSPSATERHFVRASLMNSDALMRSLGRPNREQVVTTRPDLLTTLQALDLSNGQILFDTLNRGANQLVKMSPPSQDVIETIYLKALSRKPTAQERRVAQELLGEKPNAESMADFLWVVFMLPEFQLIR